MKHSLSIVMILKLCFIFIFLKASQSALLHGGFPNQAFFVVVQHRINLNKSLILEKGKKLLLLLKVSIVGT